MLSSNRILEIFVKLYPIIPSALLVVTVVLCWNLYNKSTKYNETKGIIVDFYETTSEMRVSMDAVKAISPIVVYEINGREYRFIGNYCTTNMKIGDTVKVLYDKTYPEKALIKTGLYIAPLITGGLCVLFILPIIVSVIYKKFI